MATVFNQASLSFGGIVTNSNTTQNEVVAALTLTKTAASSDYSAGEGITYIISLVNTGGAEYTGITLTDDLGRTTTATGTEFTPLTYVDGSVLYYIDGVLQTTAPTVATDTGELVISGINVPVGGNVTIIYEARVNGFAPLGETSTITNTVTAGGTTCDLSDSAVIGTRVAANLSIAKSVSPAVVNCAGEVTYTILLQNTGNTAVTATDDLVVNDVFNPVLTGLTASLDGNALVLGTGYTYDETTGAFATLPGAITVPAATYTRDPATGLVSTTPGVATITITGTV